MDSHLNRIVEQVQTGQFTAQAAAANAPVHSGASVAVTIYITEGYADAIAAYLTDNGASPRNIGIDYIEAYAPVSLLPSASEREGVISVRKIVPLRPAQGTVVSEGVVAHGVPAWHSAGLKGQGVRIGIIDIDFKGFQSLMGTELPAAVEARCYTDIGVFTSSLSDCENDDPHGTAVTEAVFDIAPEAIYYISNPGSGGDLKSTVEWMVEHDVDVINVSAGMIWDGPGDGTSPFSDSPLRSVDAAVAGGITWVNAAGNEATTTWFGNFSDPDGNGFHNFSADNECNQFELETFIFGAISAQLRWDDDWTGASRDLDLLLYEVLPSGELDLVTSLFLLGGIDFQEGLPGDIPHEHLIYAFASGGTYCLAVESFSGTLPEWIQLQVLTEQELAAHTLSGSITNPAESANTGLLAVGAAGRNDNIDNPFDTSIIEPFSSQGPTPDGRLKPDIVGADGGQTETLLSYGIPNGYFLGTSQASPHIAGLAALVNQNYPNYTPQQITNYLKTHAEERGVAGADNVWGHGFARLLASDASPQPTPTPSLTPSPSPTPELDQCIEEFTGSATFSDAWTSDCVSVDSAADGTGDAYALFYAFALTESSDVTVTLESSENTYLNIRQGVGKDGIIRHFNDDHDAGDFSLNLPTDSGISANLAAGDYTIEATTYESEATGNFTLTVEIGSSTTPPPPPTPVPTPTPPRGVPSDGVCRADIVVSPGESCTYPGSPTQFIVSGSGIGKIEHIASGDSIDIRVVLRAAKQSDGSWLIQEVGDLEQPQPTPTPAPSPTPIPGAAPDSPANQRYAWEGSTIVVRWDAVSSADYYTIYYDDFFDDSCRLSSSGSPGFCEELATNVTATSYTHSSPDEDENYYWVVACNSIGCSEIDEENPARLEGSAPVPDLVVGTLTTSSSSLATGESFTLSATVHNQGNSSSNSTTLRYYRSSDATITDSDTLAGTDHVSRLDPAESGDEDISLTAPSTAGTYYYGACVDSVTGESDTTNNCSRTVQVTVSSGGGNASPGSPANQRYVWQGSTIVISWDAVSGTDYYKIYNDQHFSATSRCHLTSFGSPIHCHELATNVMATSYAHTSPDEDENYYWVVACNSVGCSDIDSANPASFIDTRPESPANQRYVRQGPTTVVSWDAVSDADYYTIYYDDFFDDSCRLSSSGSPSFCEELATNVTATSYTHSSPDEDENYYWIVACNSDGCSDIDSDNPAEFVDTRTGSPSNQRYVWQDSATVVSWDAVSGADYYNIYYDDYWASECTLLSSGSPYLCEELATNVTATSYTHTDPDEDATNYYWVVGCNSGGCSDIDSNSPARLEGSVPVFDLATSVRVVGRTSSSLTVMWHRYVDTHRDAHFELQRSTSLDSGYSLVASNLTGNEHQDGGLSPNTTYYYKIRSCNEVGCSLFSDAKGGITESDGPVDIPSSPTGIQGRKVDVSFATDYAIVTWDAVQGATYYEVYKNSRHDKDISAPQTRYEDHESSLFFGFRGGTYTVKACNKAGCSAPTSGVTVLDASP